MKRFLVAAVVAAVVVGALGAQSQAAIDFNKQGLELYKQGKYQEAVPLFEQAIAADSQYVYGHYNLACTLGILLREDFCSHLEDVERIYAALQTTLELKPSHREKMIEDEDLSTVRGMFWFWQLVGYSVYDPEQLQVILRSITWAMSSVGVYGPPERIDFRFEDCLRYDVLVVDENGNVAERHYEGTWNLDLSGYEPVIVLIVDQAEDQQYTYRATLNSEGLLYLDGVGMFYAYIADCGA